VRQHLGCVRMHVFTVATKMERWISGDLRCSLAMIWRQVCERIWRIHGFWHPASEPKIWRRVVIKDVFTLVINVSRVLHVQWRFSCIQKKTKIREKNTTDSRDSWRDSWHVVTIQSVFEFVWLQRPLNSNWIS